MAEIIKIDGAKVKIGLNNGKITTVPIAVLAYANPVAGDEVKVYKDGDEIIIKKANQKISVEEKPIAPVIHINNNNVMNGANDNFTKKVSKAAYLLLLIFLGWLGVHRFMRGQVGIGILYFLTIGLLGWGAIVDLIIALTKLNKYDGEYAFTRHGDWA
jgi:TM2 domain-containing membrane protein YozV